MCLSSCPDVTCPDKTVSCRALGLLASRMTPPTPAPTPPCDGSLEDPPPHSNGGSPSPEAVSLLLSHLVQLVSAQSALHRMVAVLVVCHWDHCPSHTLNPSLQKALTDTGGLEELVPFILNMQKDCQVCVCVRAGGSCLCVCVFSRLLWPWKEKVLKLQRELLQGE